MNSVGSSLWQQSKEDLAAAAAAKKAAAAAAREAAAKKKKKAALEVEKAAAAAAEKAAAEAAKKAAAEKKATIDITLGGLLHGLDSTGGVSSLQKEAEEDSGERSEKARMRSEMRSYAMAVYSDYPLELRKKLEKEYDMAQKFPLLKVLPQSNSSKKQPLKSERSVSANSADMNSEGGLKLAKRGYTKKSMKNQEAGRPQESVTEAVSESGKTVVDTSSEGSDSFIQDESENEVGRPEESVTDAGEAEEAVAELNSEGSYSFTQEESVNELEMRSEMMGFRPEMQLYEEEECFRKAILRALLDIKEKLEKKKTDKDTLLLLLRLLNVMSKRLDEGGYDEKNEKDQVKSAIEACLDTNVGTDTTMVESDIKPAADPSATNSITIQAETLRQMVRDLPGPLRSGPAIQKHMPMVGSDKLLIQPAGPIFADSVSRLGPYSLQDYLHHDQIAEEMSDDETAADKKMAYEAESFADYRRSWEAIWSKTCGSFEHMTPLNSMHFTYYTPGRNPPYSGACTPETLQIFSIKLAKMADVLGWPLSVYGVVAVRDVVDQNRNFLFYCDRNNSQELTQNDPFLRLIGPSRAVVFANTVNFEMDLKVKGTTRPQDKALIAEGRNCRHIFGHGASTVRFENCVCKIELSVQLVRRTTQATILGVQVINSEKWPFNYGARVACSSLPGKLHVTEDNRVILVAESASGELVMVDSKDGAKVKGGDGYLHLSRNVVSVEDQGMLDVEIQAYSKSGHIAAQGLVSFPAKFSKITRRKCLLGGVMVVITVAWSRVATDKCDVMSRAAYV